MTLRYITHLDTFAVIAQFHKITHGDPWKATPDCAQMVDPKLPHKTLLLRTQKNPALDNWLDDLPMVDSSELEKWKGMRGLLTRAQKAIFNDPLLKELADPTAPLGRVVVSVLAPRSVMAWHSDLGDYAKRHLRFHIPLVTNPACTLYCGAEQVHVPVGALMYLDALKQHCAGNHGHTARSHVIFELRRRDRNEAA